MTAVEIAAICAAITTVFTGFAVGLRFLVKGWLNELRPNGGSSIKDQINRLERRVDDLFILLSRDN
jgi:hypothetical protein